MTILNRLTQALKSKHLLSLAGNGVISVLAMLVIAILYRGLSIEAVGIWVFFQTVYMLLDTFRTGFLQVSLVKFYAGSPAPRAQAVLGSIWFLGIIITLLLCGVNVLALPLLTFSLGKALTYVVYWFGITFLSSLPFNIAYWKLQADQRFDQLLVLRLLQQGGFALFVAWGAFFNWLDLDTLFLGNVVCQAIASVVAFLLKWTGIRALPSRNKTTVNEIVQFGKFSVGTTISANLLRGADTFIVGYMLGPAAIAVYNLPGRLLELIEIPLRSGVATALPSMANAYNKGNTAELIYILKKYAGIMVFAFVPLAMGAFVLGDVAIALLGGGKYLHTEAANLFKIFMVLAVFYPVDRFLALALDVIHQPQANFIKVLWMLAANVVGDFVFIYLLGNIYGVAIATSLPLVIGIFYGHYRFSKIYPFHLKSIFKAGLHFVKLFIFRKLIPQKR